MKLISANRDPGVHAVTVECDCGLTFIFHSDADMVVCPNCKRRGLWRHGFWSRNNPDLVAGVSLMRSALGEADVQDRKEPDALGQKREHSDREAEGLGTGGPS